MGNQKYHYRWYLPYFFYNTQGNDGFIAWIYQEKQENTQTGTENDTRSFKIIQGVKQMKGKGQKFEDFMMEQGLYDEAKELAAKKLIAYKLKAEMETQNLSKSTVARRLHTSRVAVDNILNPNYNTSIGTLERFAAILGKRLSITLR